MDKLKIRLKELVENLGYYLYDVTYEKEGNDYILRVMIENDDYINIDDCVSVSKVVSEELDVLDPFKEAYMLEVTSAGAEKELRNSEEVKRAVGKNVYAETLEQKFEGELVSFKEDILTIKQKNKKLAKANYIDVSFIRLAVKL
jgi:ribosome maturation factor RimP